MHTLATALNAMSTALGCETQLVRYSVHSGGKRCAFFSLSTRLYLALSGALEFKPIPPAHYLGA